MTMFATQFTTPTPVEKYLARMRRSVFDIIPIVERGEVKDVAGRKHLRWRTFADAINGSLRDEVDGITKRKKEKLKQLFN
jgi:hypothetical protein